MSNMAAPKRHNATWHYLLIIAVMPLLGGSAGAWYLWPRPSLKNASNSVKGLPSNVMQSLFGGGMQNMKNMQMVKDGPAKASKGRKKDSNNKTEKSDDTSGTKSTVDDKKKDSNNKTEKSADKPAPKTTEDEKKDSSKKAEILGDKPAPKATEGEKKDSNKKTEKSDDKPKTQTIMMGGGSMTDDQKKDLEKAMTKLVDNKGGKGGFLPLGNSVVMPGGGGGKKSSENSMVKPGESGSKKPELVGSKLASLLVLLTSVVGSGCFLWLALRQRKAETT